MSILDKVDYPKDLKDLNREELRSLASELRQFIIESVSKTGGHLSSNPVSYTHLTLPTKA